ncbi:MAG: hypothetical protein JO275_13600 [Verrucomicrobia bacterium]|nr:hypothetical protein [Verrucomicrobiota bacterium]
MLIAPCLASIVTHYLPIAKSLGVLLFLLVEVAFVGCAAIGFLQPGARANLSLPAFLLPGLFVATVFAETWSLFGGLVPWANPALILIAAILAAVRWRTFANTVIEAFRKTRWSSLILFLPCLFFAALNALTNGYCHDTLLYHLAAVRWVADFGSVPGLANLHGRLGFNSALHPLAGLFGGPFGIAVSGEFVNSVIVLCTSAVLLQGIRLNRKEFFTQGSVYAALLLPLILGQLFSECLSSPQPDVAGVAVAILVTWHLREVIFDADTLPDVEQSAFLRCLMAGSLVVMLKLSYAALGLGAAALVTLIILIRRRRFMAIYIPIFLVFACSIPWVCRGYITSGYPLYPSELGAIHFDWIVPQEAASSDREWILSWARDPTRDADSVLANNDWLRPWFTTTLSDPLVLKSLVLGAVGLILGLISAPWRWQIASFFRYCCLIAPIILSLVFWFVTAPDPRFAGATIWTLAADVVFLPFVCLVSVRLLLRVFTTVLIAVFIGLELGSGGTRLATQYEQFPNFVGGTSELVPRLTYSGLAVWVPVTGDVTGPWKIPAAPAYSFNPRLELRGKTLRDGFRINPNAQKPAG